MKTVIVRQQRFSCLQSIDHNLWGEASCTHIGCIIDALAAVNGRMNGTAFATTVVPNVMTRSSHMTTKKYNHWQQEDTPLVNVQTPETFKKGALTWDGYFDQAGLVKTLSKNE